MFKYKVIIKKIDKEFDLYIGEKEKLNTLEEIENRVKKSLKWIGYDVEGFKMCKNNNDVYSGMVKFKGENVFITFKEIYRLPMCFDNIESFKMFCFNNDYKEKEWDGFSIKINKEWRNFRLDCNVQDVRFRYKKEELCRRSYLYEDRDGRIIFIYVLEGFKDEKKEIIGIDYFYPKNKKNKNVSYINDKVEDEIFEAIDNGQSYMVDAIKHFSEEKEYVLKGYDLDE